MNREDFRQILVSQFSEGFAVSYFDRSGFTEGASPVLYPWSMVANDKFRREARHILKAEGVKLGQPICEHLKPQVRRAA